MGHSRLNIHTPGISILWEVKGKIVPPKWKLCGPRPRSPFSHGLFILFLYEYKTYFCAWHPLVLFLRTVLRGPRAEIILVFAVPPWRRAVSASTMGCGGRMPTTQHIAVTLTPWATRRYAGSRAYNHHSHRKLTLMVPYFFVTFLMVWYRQLNNNNII